MTELQKAYQREYRRIKNLVKRMEARGYVIPESVKNIKPMSKTKVSSRSVTRLKNITPEAVYKKSRYVTQEGKETSGVRGRDLERESAGKKAAKTRRERPNDKKLWVEIVWKNVVEPMIDRLKSTIPETYYSKRGLVPKADEVIKFQRRAANNLLRWLTSPENREIIARAVFYAYKRGADLADALNTFLESGYMADILGSLQFLVQNLGYSGDVSFVEGATYEEEMLE